MELQWLLFRTLKVRGGTLHSLLAWRLSFDKTAVNQGHSNAISECRDKVSPTSHHLFSIMLRRSCSSHRKLDPRKVADVYQVLNWKRTDCKLDGNFH